MSGSLKVSADPRLTLVLGGARSGKSAIAERLSLGKAGNGPVYLIATAQARDAEMAERIERHRADRAASGQTFAVLEIPDALEAALQARRAGEVVLIDCLTLWLSNVMLSGGDAEARIGSLLEALSACPARIVAVSNEVGWGIVPENALARAFRDAQGRLNRRIAEQADCVIAVMAGLPIALKGAMPDLA